VLQLNVKIEKGSLARTLEEKLGISWNLQQQYPFDAGYDLRACEEEDVIIEPNKRAIVGTGLYFQIEEPYWEIQIRPRSGLAYKNGIMVVNSPGTVDFAYRNEVKVILYNSGEETFTVSPGDRIAQACFRPVPQVWFNYVDAIETSVVLSQGNRWVQEEKMKERGIVKNKREAVTLDEQSTEDLIVTRGGFGSSGVK
jgi:dUTP pyrophosphatase